MLSDLYLQHHLLLALWILVWAATIFFYGRKELEAIVSVDGSAKFQAAEKHIEMGRDFLVRGLMKDASAHFNAAVDSAPNYYVVYYHRAKFYLARSQSKYALLDLDRVLELNPDFTSLTIETIHKTNNIAFLDLMGDDFESRSLGLEAPTLKFEALLQRGSMLLKYGRLHEAHIDFEAALRREPHNREALHYYNAVVSISRDMKTAQMLLDEGDYYSAVDLLREIIQVCPWDPKLRKMRADGFIQLGDIMNAIREIKPTINLHSDSTETYLKLSSLHYMLGNTEESLIELRECLKLDPEHKKCFPFYKKVKKLAGQIKSLNELVHAGLYKDCIETANEMLYTEPEVGPFVFKAKSYRCHCLMRFKQSANAVAACSEALTLKKSAPAFCDRAEAYIQLEQIYNAAADYLRAVDIDKNLKRAQDGYQHTQNLFDQFFTYWNYYAVLGVRRTASKHDIEKAYRKLAQKWHPDNFQGADQKKEAEKYFLRITDIKDKILADL